MTNNIDRLAWRERREDDMCVCVLVVSAAEWQAMRWAVYLLALGRYSGN